MGNIDKNDDEYEKVCYLCRRHESKTTSIIDIPGGIAICSDCMQKTFDSLSNQGVDFNAINQSTILKDLNNIMNNSVNTKASEKDDEPIKDDPSNKENQTIIEESSTDSKGDDQKEDEPSKEKKNSLADLLNNPNIGFLNLSDFQNEFSNKQKIKKKKKDGEKSAPIIDINKIPAPHKIKESLDEYIIGQDHAKKVISVAVYNHYKRVATNTIDDIEIDKSNMLMIGPTGCGKTYLVKTLAKLLDVPLAIADATSLTEAGYIGDDIESVISKLLAAADNDVERAESGIVFIDEIDKIAKKKNVTNRDVSGESVQQALLKLLEGSEIEVPVGASSKNAMVPLATINTKNILFICGGAFPGLEDIVKERLSKQASMGFVADLKDKFDDEKNIIKHVATEDIRKFGMIPEFIGRLPVIYTLEDLGKELLMKVLKEPKNAILKQYERLLELDEVLLEFDEGAIEAIALLAAEKKTGARALRAIIEEFMLDIMYEIPKDDNIGKVTITKDYIEKKGGPIIEMRTTSHKENIVIPIPKIEPIGKEGYN